MSPNRSLSSPTITDSERLIGFGQRFWSDMVGFGWSPLMGSIYNTKSLTFSYLKGGEV